MRYSMTLLAILPLASLVACEGENDDYLCDPACPTGQVCVPGAAMNMPNQCVPQEDANQGGNGNGNGLGGLFGGDGGGGTPGNGGEPAAPGEFGAACGHSDDCNDGVCVEPPNERGYCSQLCNGGDCPNGFECAEVGPDTRVCLAAEGGQPEQPQPGPAPANGASCGQIVECFQGCQDEACAQRCVDAGSAPAQQAFGALLQCVQQSNCGQDNSCEQACGAQIQACVNQGGQPSEPTGGNLSCGDVFGCFDTCGQDDQACFQGCFERGSAVGQQQVNSVLDCVQRTGCADNNSCEQACGAEIQACFGGQTSDQPAPPADRENPQPAPPAGGGCGTALQCIVACNDDACASRCTEGLSQRSGQLLESLGACLQRTQCQDDCQEQCGAEVQACMADG